MKRLTATTLLLFLCGCKDTKQVVPLASGDAATPQYRQPSATELFDLQSKCTALGDKIMRENFIGVALTQQQISHYNPKDNRCYVELEVSSADLTTPQDKFISDNYLFDGQTGEMLADTTREGQKRGGMVFDSSLQELMEQRKVSMYDPNDVGDLIDSFVATDRRQ